METGVLLHGARALTEILDWRSEVHPDRVALEFLDGEMRVRQVLTYGDLAARARGLAAAYESSLNPGGLVLVLCKPGLEYVVAFFACLYAGAIAVPAYPPRRNRSVDRIRSILGDCRARVALVTAEVDGLLGGRPDPEFAGLERIVVSLTSPCCGERTPWSPPSQNAPAYLQYTSGSTSTPKGVVVTHANLLNNLRSIATAFRSGEGTRSVSWLPPYHDMGLIGEILEPVFAGATTTLMAPWIFLQNPLRWLQAISQRRADINGAPNFAYDLCVRKVAPQQREGLDLSCWQVAFCGAEPVSAATLCRFADYFGPCGFRWESFYPCYGLAEATLLVTGGRPGASPVEMVLDPDAFGRGEIRAASLGASGSRTLVGSGSAMSGHEIAIVEPESGARRREDEIGEVWVRGPSVTGGYWNQPEATRSAFGATISPDGTGPFLRTGDLGFVHDGELFVTGRLKEMMIIHGRNHYPHDIEQTVSASHQRLEPDGAAAFSVVIEGQERLVVVQEVRRERPGAEDFDEVFAAARAAVADGHDLDLFALVLIRNRTLLRTSSGKIQRLACRADFLGGTLDVVAQWRRDETVAPLAVETRADSPPDPGPDRRGGGTPATAAAGPEAEAIERWLVGRIAAELGMPASRVDVHAPFLSFGFDSLRTIQVSGELEEFLGRHLSPTLLWDHPSIRALAGHLGGRDEPVTSRDGEPSTSAAGHEPIAVVGLACRFPGAGDSRGFWELLRQGQHGIVEVPPDRWDINAFYDSDPDAPGKMSTRWGGFLPEIDQFDPAFFGIPPREAVLMDPQQRLLLELAWEAWSDAGCPTRRRGAELTSVFVGVSNSDYGRLVLGAGPLTDAYAGTGNALSIAANRVSYVFDFRGPSLAIDTACSSSLAAVHLAVRSLRAGECRWALAGGVNLMLMPEATVNFSKARMMAADGRCKVFDATADGYVRGEGCGVVVLRRLRDALADGDRVLAVIRGSAINQDGRSNGLTAPNGPSQEAVLRAALADAGLTPEAVDYVEAHGTGTELGDSIEVRSLANVFGPGRAPGDELAIGSVKTNIGHLEAAAGVAGLIKVILALQVGEIPPHLNLQSPSPLIPWWELPVSVPVTARPWRRRHGKRVAGVSSFGFGGTNVHVVVEEAPVVAPAEAVDDRPVCLVAVSGKSAEAARELAGRYGQFLGEHPDVPLADVAFTANARRTHFTFRRAAVAGSRAELEHALRAIAVGAPDGQLLEVIGTPQVAFLFTGQGAQYAGMGKRLYETQTLFRDCIRRCDRILGGSLGNPLPSVLFSDGASLDQTAYTQPALFALEYALAELWRSWGVEPAAVLGHSIGEYVAAYIAGVFDLETGLRLAAERGRLIQSLPAAGSMLAVFAGEAVVAAPIARFAGSIGIAAVNGPMNTVLSGDSEALKIVAEELGARGIATRSLRVSHAFHSPLMEPILDAFEEFAARFRLAAPRIPLVSNVRGAIAGEEVARPDYWRRHILAPVRFADGLRSLYDRGHRLFLEVGPQPVLAGLTRSCLPEDAVTVTSLKRGMDDWRPMLQGLADLYGRGVAVDWEALEHGSGCRQVDLPPYPFQRQRYWIAVPRGAVTDAAEIGSAPAHRPWEGAVSEVSRPVPMDGPVGANGSSSRSGRRPADSVGEPSAGLNSTPADDPAEAAALIVALTAAPLAERRRLLIQRIGTQIAQVLGLTEPPPSHRGFFELGMDSLMATQLRNRLEKTFGRPFPATLTFNHPTIESLSEYLLVEVLHLAPATRMTAADGRARTDEPIAVVGLSCRFPGGAEDPDSYWGLLRDGIDASGDMPADRWDATSVFDPNPEAVGTSYTRRAGFLWEPIDQFDPRFFGIAPREAAHMDPQQRLLLELSWEALERAGLAADRLRATRTGVFIGINTNDYSRAILQGDPRELDAYAFTGNTFSVAAGRISHLLGLHGPSLAIDTACSSSLVAVHLACQNLRSGECDAALAGGVNLMLTPEGFVILSRMRALAPDGRCKPFDAAADGYGRGEGGGVLVLKRLSDALRDGDLVWAIVRGSAVNHDGPSSGLTVPNGAAQEALIREALARAGVAPWQVGYLEAHGTGTALGDPIEISAAAAVLGQGRECGNPLPVGSVKANIGHLEAAAGVAGLIKVVLALRHRQIPAHRFQTPSRAIDWSAIPVVLPRSTADWPSAAGPRIAAVSSFGMSGTNAFVILQEAEAPTTAVNAVERPLHLLTLSAAEEAPLRQLAARYRDDLASRADIHLADVAQTANTGRVHLAHRAAVVAGSVLDASRRLGDLAIGLPTEGTACGRLLSERPLRVAFLFSGPGSADPQMARRLFESQPTFREALQRCEDLLRPTLARPLLSVLYPEPGAEVPEWETLYAPVALLAVQSALAELWRSWGIEPDYVLGYGLGEFAAAVAAGVTSLESGLGLVAKQAGLTGGLVAVGAAAVVLANVSRIAEVTEPFRDAVSVAASHAPDRTVIAGRREAVLTALRLFDQRRIAWQRLDPSLACHSPLVEPILDEWERAVGSVALAPPKLVLVSGLTGGMMSPEEIVTPGYWRRQLREPIAFSRAVETLHQDGATHVLEIGPHPVLGASGRRCLPADDVRWLSTLRRGSDDWAEILSSLGRLYVDGQRVNWAAFDRDYARLRVPLPTYPFNRRRYWIGAPRPAPLPGPSANGKGAIPADRNGQLHKAPGGDEEGRDRAEGPHDPSRWLHHLEWVPIALDPRVPGGDPKQARGVWVIFADRSGVGAALARRLQHQGATTALVMPGECYGRRDDGAYQLDPLQPDHFHRLCAEIVDRDGAEWRGLLHLWGLDAPLGAEMTDEELAAAQRLGSASVLHLAQALLQAGGVDLVPLWVVTRGAQAVGDEVGLSPAQSLLWGLGSVVALESPEIWGGLVDLDPAVSAPEDDTDALLAVVQAADPENRVSFRSGRPYAARLVLSPPIPDPAGPRELSEDASYLITGGLGSLGLNLAGWMADRGARHLVLMGRREPSEAARQVIVGLERRGVAVTVERVDVTDRTALSETLRRLAGEKPPVRGIIHAAGVLDDGIVPQLTWERFRDVLAPKVSGAWHLHTLTRDLALDFFVLFSSAASVLGSPGQASYAAANAFLDALARSRRRQGLPALSIAWGPWSEVGMAAELRARTGRQWTPAGITPVPLESGLRLLERLLAGPRDQQCVLPVDWPTFADHLPIRWDPRLLGELVPAVTESWREAGRREPRARLAQRLAEASPGERPELMVSFLQEAVGAALGLSADQRPDPREGFFELGLDSLMAVELKNRLTTHLGRAVPTTAVFRYPNINSLAEYLIKDLLKLEDSGASFARREGEEGHRTDTGIAPETSHRYDEFTEAELLHMLADELACDASAGS